MTKPNPDLPERLADSISPADLPDEPLSLALLARAREGDERALHELLERYEDRLLRIVRIQLAGSPLRRAFESMDVVQDTYLAALPKIRTFEPRSAASVLQWLARIATNQLRDAHERQRAARRDVRRTSPLSTTAGAAAASEREAPALRAELHEIRELLDDAVSRLPEDQRRVVILRDYCGEAWDAIAADLQRAGGATRQLHQRAWIGLRREVCSVFADELPEEGDHDDS